MALTKYQSAQFTDDSGSSFIERVNGVLQKSDDNGQTFGPFSSGGGFSSDTIVQLPNSLAALVNALELILQLSPNTAGSEVSNWVIKLLRAGAQAQVAKFDGGNVTLEVNPASSVLGTPSVKVNPVAGAAPSVGFFANGATIGYVRGDGAANMNVEALGNNLGLYVDGQQGTGTPVILLVGAAGGHAIQMLGRMEGNRGAPIAVATTITLGADGPSFPLTVGTGTLNSIVATNWRAGSWALLECASGITITHNVAGTGATILTNTGASIVTARTQLVWAYYNGTNWIAMG